MLRVLSYGGGVQSTALLVLAAQRELIVDLVIYADPGQDAEHPDTVAYVRDVAQVYARQCGLSFEVVSAGSLYQRLLHDHTSVPIPVWMPGGVPARRNCTVEYKIRPIYRAIGARATDRRAVVYLGISADEGYRMRLGDQRRYGVVVRNAYPLVDRRMTRSMCRELVASSGLPVPGKSSCWFCPYHSPDYWRRLRLERPDLYRKAVDLERLLSQRRVHLGRDGCTLARGGSIASDLTQLSFWPSDNCESGYCEVGV